MPDLIAGFLKPSVTLPILQLGPNAPPAASVNGVVQGFAVPKQTWGNWCWAAVGTGVGALRGHPTDQCHLACSVLHRADCCGPAGADPNICNMMAELTTALAAVGVTAPAQEGYTEFAAIQSEVSGRNVPVCARIRWRSRPAIAHYIAISGWRVASDGGWWVTVADPDYGNFADYLYAVVRNNYKGDGDWSHSYFVR